MTLSMFVRYTEFSIIYTEIEHTCYVSITRFERCFSNFTSQYAMFGWCLPYSARRMRKGIGKWPCSMCLPQTWVLLSSSGRKQHACSYFKSMIVVWHSPTSQILWNKIQANKTRVDCIYLIHCEKKRAKRSWPHSVIDGEEQARLLLMMHKKIGCTSAFVPFSWESSTSDCLLMPLLQFPRNSLLETPIRETARKPQCSFNICLFH